MELDNYYPSGAINISLLRSLYGLKLTPEMTEDRYFTNLAAAFVQGKLGQMPQRSVDEIIQTGLDAGLRLHKFKRNAELPRVKKALGVLRGLAPESLLDVGSGRGTFLFPLLDEFSYLSVTAIDLDERRAIDLDALRRGGLENFAAVRADVTQLGFENNSFDVVTMLEVLEHLTTPEKAATEALRVARHFVLLSVPSKEDDNPEHLHLFDARRIEAIFASAGAKSVKFDYVLNHLIAVVKI
jgi:2-polyprenyl-3-methyl-5-hydroxy-6-metoxy-1,4-benzoquinol methylase